MVKFLFFDYRSVETAEGFVRRLEPPQKHPGNPFLLSDLPSEMNLMSFYGSVIRRPDGLWQAWYKCYNPNGRGPALGYAESDDGLRWRRPSLDVVRFQDRGTNIVFDQGPHGTAVLRDEREERPGWRYKMVHGAKPTERLSGHRSPDGIHWSVAGENPLLNVTSGGPIGFLRAGDGRYVLYLRPTGPDRRIARAESWDFLHWSEPRIVLDQDPADPPQVQYYGMDAFEYGAYEIGLPWMYLTDAADMDFGKPKGRMVPELAYARSGYAWHHAARGEDWIGCGEPGAWDAGQIHPASQAVFLPDEVRFYYCACRVPHEAATRGAREPEWGMGFASCKPDRFVALAAAGEAALLTRPFWTETPEFYVNADVAREGWIRAELTDAAGNALPGFGLGDCAPVTGDGVRHRIRWSAPPAGAAVESVANRQVRLRVTARDAKLYALFSGGDAEYWKFRIPHYLHMEAEKAQS